MEWQDPSDPAKGFQYLYLNDTDRSRLTAGAAKPTFQVPLRLGFARFYVSLHLPKP